jgi:FixJ family two-component response regulator
VVAPTAQMARAGVVFVVEDDPPLRRALAGTLEDAGWQVRSFGSATEFLGQVEIVHPACVLMEFSMHGATGLEVQRELAARSIETPIVLLSGRGTILSVTNALISGAFDFLVVPVAVSVLIERVERAMLEDLRRADRARERCLLDALTGREIEACELLARGLAPEQIARELSISVPTLERHRVNILEKTRTTTTSELVSLYLRARKPMSNPSQL